MRPINRKIYALNNLLIIDFSEMMMARRKTPEARLKNQTYCQEGGSLRPIRIGTYCANNFT
jgi:hypothetical protein